MSLQLTLPWPPKDLSPNARLHWSRLAKAKKSYRHDCAVFGNQMMRGQYLPLGWSEKTRLRISLTFRPPSRQRRDLDNLVASMKAGLDGLADAIGVDDSRWQLVIEMGEPVKGGCVCVTVDAVGDAAAT
jgi:crossover junction endodeoxyribonuclease RusA